MATRREPHWEREIAELDRFLETRSYPQAQQYLVSKSSPRFLFKFRPLHPPQSEPLQNQIDLDRIRRILVDSTLWLSSPRHFNDPFDMKARFLVTATALQRRERFKAIFKVQGRTRSEVRILLPRYMAMSDSEVEAQVRETYLKMTNESGVCSFAGDPQNILMWSHYGSDHQGVCFIFDVAKDPKTFVRAVEVKYSAEYPVVNWITEFRKPQVITSIILRKHNGWRYERERRIVEPDQADQAFSFRPEALRAIIIGCSMTDETLKSVRRLLTDRALELLPKVHLYRCEMHESEYKLRIRKLERDNL